MAKREEWNEGLLIQLWNEGVGAAALSERFSITESALKSRVRILRREGVELRQGDAGDWTAERTADFIRRWNAGESTTDLAIAYGVTRSAISGKVKRLRESGAEMRGEPASKPSAEAINRKAKAPESPRENRTFTKIATTPAVVPVIPSTRVPDPEPIVERDADEPGRHACGLMDLTNSRCKWPLGPLLEPSHLFCGEPLAEDRDQTLPPYCACHLKRAVSPPNDKRRSSVKDLIRGLRRYAA